MGRKLEPDLESEPSSPDKVDHQHLQTHRKVTGERTLEKTLSCSVLAEHRLCLAITGDSAERLKIFTDRVIKCKR